MSRRLALTPAARAGLVAVRDHTIAAWGERQAQDYLTGLDRLFSLLAEHPEIAPERMSITPPVRLHPWRSHLVIFRAPPGWLEVLRVVHARAHWTALLDD